MQDNTDYGGNDIVFFRDAEVTGTWEECGRLCNTEPRCKFWTWFKDNYPRAILRGKCLLKTAKENVQTPSNPMYISGSRTCPVESGNY